MDTLLWDDSANKAKRQITYLLRLLTSHWISLLAITIIGGLGMLLFQSLRVPTYQATATIYVNLRQANNITDFNTLRASESLAQTYAELVTTRRILELAATDLRESGYAVHASDLERAVTADPVTGTQLIYVTVVDQSPLQAAKIANTLSNVLIDEIRLIETADYSTSENQLTAQIELLDEDIEQLENELAILDATDNEQTRASLENLLAEVQQNYVTLTNSRENIRLAKLETSPNIHLFEEARVPEGAQDRLAMQYAIIVASLCFLGASMFVVGKDLLDDTSWNPDQFSEMMGIPILGRISHIDDDDAYLITSHAPRAPQAESFRTMRLNLDYISPDKAIKNILVVSAFPAAGKSFIASNLGVIMAQGGKETLLLDCDLRKPKLHQVFGADNHAGLSSLFLPDANDLYDLVEPTQTAMLKLVSAGVTPPNPSELLYSQKTKELIQTATEKSDMVIIDGPPIIGMTDSLALAQYVDGVLIVVHSQKTPQHALVRVIGALQQVNANILGFVVNNIEQADNLYDYSYEYGTQIHSG